MWPENFCLGCVDFENVVLLEVFYGFERVASGARDKVDVIDDCEVLSVGEGFL